MRRGVCTIEPLEQKLLFAGDFSILSTPIVKVHSSAVPAPTAGYSPSITQTAYGINMVDFNGKAGNGAGQTIAILDEQNDPDIVSDLTNFDSTFNLSAPPSFVVENENGTVLNPATILGPGANPTQNKNRQTWTLETDLDVEWSHAVAPGASILLIEENGSLTDIHNAINTAIADPSVSVVSMSFGTSGTIPDSDFTVPPGRAPITFVASSGDSGPPTPIQYPAGSINVLAVGGTTLNVNTDGSWQS